ncbi:hypothetical protein KJ937_02600 [Patescibacteria group bacterium]|nr:hypothetical protein [Patescibacteria group bacterium]
MILFHRLTLISLGLMILAALASPGITSATEIESGLVKSESYSAVYYLEDGKRYTFPNESVYFSWYDDFLSVKTITDQELASYNLAGNITYRPGTLIKVQTDPKVYAISRHGILHWVSTEQLASKIFGQDWNKQVYDVADTFFINYKVDSAINSESAYDVDAELAVMNINQNLNRVPILRLLSQPAPNQAHMRLIKPIGEDVSWTVIVEGKEPTDPMLAICVEPNCSFIIEFNGPQYYTAFTSIGEKIVGSNNIFVRPLRFN